MKNWKKMMVISAIVIMICATFISQFIILRTDRVVHQPFTIEHSDELSNGEWETFGRLPREEDIRTIDLTYGTFHEYIRITHRGDDVVYMNISLETDARYEAEKNYIGFVIFEGIVGPRDISWNQTSAINHNGAERISWGYQEKDVIMGAGETRNYTIISVLNRSAPSPRIYERMWIRWHFESDDIVIAEPIAVEFPLDPRERLSPLTPFTFTTSIISAIVIGYIIFKDKVVV